MHTTIVVPLDGSKFARRALPAALALARRSGATLHLVHVHEPVVYSGSASMHETRLDDELRREMRTDLSTLAEQVSRETSLPAQAEFLDGAVVPTLLRYIAERAPDLVVMMTHGRGGLSRMWLGSVADGLLRGTSAALLLVRPGTEWPGDLSEPLFRRVLIPLDGSTMAEEVLDIVGSLGTPGVTVYTLLTVVVPPPLLARSSMNSEATTDRADVEPRVAEELAYLKRTAEELRESGALAEAQVVMHQRPAEGILEYAEKHAIDLIALSAHGRGALSRFFLGGVADKVVRGAAVPVLVRRPESVGAEAAGAGPVPAR